MRNKTIDDSSRITGAIVYEAGMFIRHANGQAAQWIEVESAISKCFSRFYNMATHV